MGLGFRLGEYGIPKPRFTLVAGRAIKPMEPDLRQSRHDLLGKLNAITLCATALGGLDSQEAEIEFLDMLIDATDQLTIALEAYETAADRISSRYMEPM